jgi:carbon storage regulator
MLILSRRPGQKIILDHSIELVVLEVKGDIVKLGFTAPANISIFRAELYEEVMKNNQQAVQSSIPTALTPWLPVKPEGYPASGHLPLSHKTNISPIHPSN